MLWTTIMHDFNIFNIHTKWDLPYSLCHNSKQFLKRSAVQQNCALNTLSLICSLFDPMTSNLTVIARPCLIIVPILAVTTLSSPAWFASMHPQTTVCLMPYNTLSKAKHLLCRTLPSLTLLFLTVPCLTLHFLTLPFLTLPFLALPFFTLPFFTLPFLALPFLPCPSLYPAVLYPAIPYLPLLPRPSSLRAPLCRVTDKDAGVNSNHSVHWPDRKDHGAAHDFAIFDSLFKSFEERSWVNYQRELPIFPVVTIWQ